MAERPILFSAPMVRAILNGTKTQTRRVVKWRGLEPGLNLRFTGLSVERSGSRWVLTSPSRIGMEYRSLPMLCPYGQPGDRLWVREAFFHEPADYCWEASVSIPCSPAMTVYRADHAGDTRGAGWKPSIHMPRWASRITLEIVSVRVERLQDISEADAVAEGIERVVVGEGWRRYDPSDAVEAAGLVPCETARASFRSLWQSINGLGSWDRNEWVWAIEFRRLETPHA